MILKSLPLNCIINQTLRKQPCSPNSEHNTRKFRNLCPCHSTSRGSKCPEPQTFTSLAGTDHQTRKGTGDDSVKSRIVQKRLAVIAKNLNCHCDSAVGKLAGTAAGPYSHRGRILTMTVRKALQMKNTGHLPLCLQPEALQTLAKKP